MTVSICIPTLNRYDLLNQLIVSLQAGTLKPDHIYVIDNGGGYISKAQVEFMDGFGILNHYIKFGHNLGCAASWNWFSKNVPEIRLIVNDDVVFAPDALERWVDSYDPEQIICPDSLRGSNAFSAFSMPDAVIAKVGLFDETISPKYCYLEDNDLAYRMKLVGMEIESASGVLLTHGLSSTLKNFTPQQTQEHHERFRLAMKNYREKWGGLPNRETYTIPYNGTRPDTASVVLNMPKEETL